MSIFQRNIESIEQGVYDVLVIGGGIVGLSVAEDAARRGLRVLLLERGDFGALTSAGCFRLVHGGMRYLQHLDLGRMYESVREQIILRRRAPHLVRPRSFLIPCYGSGKEGRLLLEAGMWLYELLTPLRNRGFPGSERLPRHSFVGRDKLLELHPGLAHAGLKGAVRLWDCQMMHAERLTLAAARSAAQAGASVFNYIEVEALEQARQKSGAKGFNGVARDRFTQKPFRFSALCAVNAAGPSAGALVKKWFGEQALEGCPHLAHREFSKGFQVVLPGLPGEEALAVRSAQDDAASKLRRGKRSYFLVPWREYTLAGTTDEAVSGTPGEFDVSADEVKRFVLELAANYSSPAIRYDAVLQTFGGYLPAEEVPVKGGTTEMRILRDDVIFDHRSAGKPVSRFLSVAGVKYTTARGLAEHVVDWVAQTLGRALPRSSTALHCLFGGNINSLEQTEKELLESFRPLFSGEGDEPRKIVHDFVMSYGSEAQQVLGRVSEVPGPLGDRFLEAQISYGVKEEMAMTLSDLVFRRTLLAAGGKPPAALLQQAAGRCQELLGWDDARRNEEVARVYSDRRYSFLDTPAAEGSPENTPEVVPA